MRFEGRFCPPTVGVSAVPFPITDSGTCTTTDDGLRVEGLAPAGGAALRAILGALAFVAGALAVKFTVMPGMSGSMIGTIGGAGLATGLLAPARGSKATPVSHVLPWSRIKKVEKDLRQPGAVIILVADHNPKGAIHFAPADVDAFIAEIAGRAGIANR